MTEEQRGAVERMQEAMGDFVTALRDCHLAGLTPVEAFRACGIEIPSIAVPLVNQQMLALIPADVIEAA